MIRRGNRSRLRIPVRYLTQVHTCLLHLTAALLLAVCAPLLAHDDPNAQIDRLTSEIERYPIDAQLFLARGGLHRMQGHWQAALADFDRAAQLDPYDSAIAFHRARIYFEAGAHQVAREILDRFLTEHPTHLQGLVTRARALRKLDQQLLAAKDYSRALAQISNPTAVLFLERADALAAAGNQHLVAAIDGLDEGIAQVGPVILLQSRAVDLELRAHRYGAALSRIDEILSTMPRKERWLVRRGEVLEQVGLNDQAHATYAEALAAIERLPSRLGKTPALLALAADLTNRLEVDPADDQEAARRRLPPE